MQGVKPGNTVEVRFWKKVHKEGFNGCWIWNGDSNSKVNPLLRINGKYQLAYRVSWFFETGEWPTLQLNHKCDKRRCVNPNHLFEGTQLDNMRDMIAKGRKVNHDSSGGNNGRSAMTDVKALEVKQDYDNGTMSVKELSDKHGISTAVAYKLLSGRVYVNATGGTRSPRLDAYHGGVFNKGR